MRNASHWCVVCRAVKFLGRPAVATLTSVVHILIAWNCIFTAVTLRQMIFAAAKKTEGKVEATAMRGELVRVESLVPLQVARVDKYPCRCQQSW